MEAAVTFRQSIVAVLLLISPGLIAQTPSGEISGVVVDPSGSVVPGVTVTVTNPATNAVRSAQTNEAGLYTSRALPPGASSIKAEDAGFRSVEPRAIDET